MHYVRFNYKLKEPYHGVHCMSGKFYFTYELYEDGLKALSSEEKKELGDSKVKYRTKTYHVSEWLGLEILLDLEPICTFKRTNDELSMFFGHENTDDVIKALSDEIETILTSDPHQTITVVFHLKDDKKPTRAFNADEARAFEAIRILSLIESHYYKYKELDLL